MDTLTRSFASHDQQTGRFFGKYRGLVTDNDDPLNMGRIRAKFRSDGRGRKGWALPALPFSGDGMGMYTVPPRMRACGSSSNPAIFASHLDGVLLGQPPATQR